MKGATLLLLSKLVIFFISLQLAKAAETDAFTSRYVEISDSIPELNREVNLRFDQTIQILNQSKKCEWSMLDQVLGSKLRRPIYGEIEQIIHTSEKISKIKVDMVNSVYANIPFINRAPIILGSIIGIGLTDHIHHQGLLIGADKFGHFLDEGYYYYQLIHRWNYTLEEALEFGIILESTIDGLWTSGIFSHADLVANYEGLQFWENALLFSKEKDKTKYFSCINGNWSRNEVFTWTNYIHEGWDEGMNCNRYQNNELEMQIKKNIETYETKYNKKYQCPVYPERVNKMKLRYGKFSDKIIFKFN